MTKKMKELDLSKQQWLSYSFVGLLLAGVFRGFAGVGADLHVHGIDDVEEILHHRHALQGRVNS